MKNYLLLHLVISILIGLPGCKKQYEFLPSEVPQSKVKPIANGEISTWIKSVRIYNQFRTVGLFRLLKVSDEVAMISCRNRAQLDGVSGDSLRPLLENAVRDNQYELIFYMLASVAEDLEVPLGKERSPWRFSLKLADGSHLQPTNINEVMWTPELSTIFGCRYRPHWQLIKLTYPLAGSIRDPAQGYLRSGPLQIFIRNPQHQVVLSWPAEEGWSAEQPLAAKVSE